MEDGRQLLDGKDKVVLLLEALVVIVVLLVQGVDRMILFVMDPTNVQVVLGVEIFVINLPELAGVVLLCTGLVVLIVAASIVVVGSKRCW